MTFHGFDQSSHLVFGARGELDDGRRLTTGDGRTIDGRRRVTATDDDDRVAAILNLGAAEGFMHQMWNKVEGLG